MRASVRLSGLLAFSLCMVSSIFAQTNPPPSDPHELVVHQPRTLSSPAERSAAIDLLEHAREDLNMHAFGAYELKASFQTNGATQNEGNGTMEELSNGPAWRWAAQMQGASVVRVGVNGHAYGANPNEPVPLRIQEIRAALHWPILRNPGGAVIRSANTEMNGKPVTCLLLNAAVPENPAPRAWVEEEYCIDSATGLLQMWSAAPGIYTEYDYEGAADFNGHTLPRQISIFEGGGLVVQARVESFGDPGKIDPNAFKAGPEMTDAGESFTLSGARRFPMRVDPSDGAHFDLLSACDRSCDARRAGRARDRCRSAPEFQSGFEPCGIGAGEELVVPCDGISAGSFYQRAISSAGAGSGRGAGVAFFCALGDLGAPGEIVAEEAGSRRGLRILRIGDSHRVPLPNGLRSILAMIGQNGT